MPARISSVFFTGMPSLPARSFMLSKALYSALGIEMLSRTILIFFSLGSFLSVLVTLLALASALGAAVLVAFAVLTAAFTGALVLALVGALAAAFGVAAAVAAGLLAGLATGVFTAAAATGAAGVGAAVLEVSTAADSIGVSDWMSVLGVDCRVT